MRRILIYCVLLVAAVQSNAQGYYRNPTNLPMLLSGNFGELRPGHYHMGLDIKTAAVENKPIYAAAEGFVSRVKVEPGGYGRAIYIQHPNGTTTLYAHLNDFTTSLEKWVKDQQYLQQSWAVDLYPEPRLFPVKKGEFIANSGNTGGSLAPHLHFEIRDTKDGFNLNPLLYQFPVEDKIAPLVTRLAIYDKAVATYAQQPLIIPVKKMGNKYTSQAPVVKVNAKKIVTGFSAYDTHNGSNNKNGIYHAQLFLNGKPDIAFLMDSIHYEDTRYMNAHIDYKTATTRSNWIHQLFELPGYYPNSIYTTASGNGVIDLSDGKVHTIKIEIRDAYKNLSILETKLQFSGMEKKHNIPAGKVFYPGMLDGFESSNAEFFIGEKCLYEAVTIEYAEQKPTDSNAISAMHKIGQAYIPLQTSFLVRIKPSVQIENSLRSKVLMLWTSGTKRSAAKVNWNQEWASAQFRDFGSYQLVLDTVAPVVRFNFANGSNQSGKASISFNVADRYGYSKVTATIDGRWICFTNDKYRSFIYRFDEHCLPGEHELKVEVTDLAGNTTTETIKFSR